eukprot:COSAG04_NODE_31680_length_255_cov_0.942308_1_plen_22_part_01
MVGRGLPTMVGWGLSLLLAAVS